MENKKYIIREVGPEACDFSFYFDGDGLTSRAGDFCYTLFIIGERRECVFNTEAWTDVFVKASELYEMFDDIKAGDGWYAGFYRTYKDCMNDNGIPFTTRKCHELKKLFDWFDPESPADIAKYLTITTGRQWAVASARGYCQGDYVELVYCKDFYADGVEKYGEVWLGAAKEFCVIDLDENGEEADEVYGYIVADCEAWRDEDYKRIVCEWAGIPQEETQLEMIDGSHTYTKYDYRIA